MALNNEMLDEYIEARLDDGWGIEEIKFLGTDNECDFLSALEDMVVDELWPRDLTLTTWSEYVERSVSRRPRPLVIRSINIASKKARKIGPSSEPDDAWPLFKRHLRNEGLSDRSIANIENSAFSVLGQLENDTTGSGPIKGLVYGSVQSGKTAVMESLISAAADNDFNVFVILSGTIENLRQQTEGRFARDLQNSPNVNWTVFDIGHGGEQLEPGDMQLDPLGTHDNDERYVTVCLKQASRLRALIGWLYKTPSITKRIRLILIDDEADQASVNTATILPREKIEEGHEQDRRTINRLITNLVNGRLADGSKPSSPMRAINYISFTATPYANVLNEKPGESLYPKDFVHSLQNADEYFGVEAIFGNPDVVDREGREDYPGLDVVREISENETAYIKNMHKEGESGLGCVLDLPSLHRSLAWFVASAALLRSVGWRRPISMLIHTSFKTDHQLCDFHSILDYFAYAANNPREIEFIRSVYATEGETFTFGELSESFSRYGWLDEVPFREMPPFSQIEGEVLDLLGHVGHIELEHDGGQAYARGINVCLDNCRSQQYADEGEYLRALYPTKDELRKMPKAPVFVVMGGNTLSRGLTLEGLCCSFFARNVTQADTLMQMGRWFGYRKGYELLQRVWLTRTTWDEYRAMAKLEYELKNELKHFEETGQRPEELGIKVSTMPEISRFRIAAKNKMQSAVAARFDFTGCTQETTEFDSSTNAIERNNSLIRSYIDGLDGRIKRSEGRSAVVWRGESTEGVLSLLDDYELCSPSGLERSFPAFRKWLEMRSGDIDSWSIAVAGKPSFDSAWSLRDGTCLPKIERTRYRGRECIDIGSLRSGVDALCDITEDMLSSDEQRRGLVEALRTRSELPARRSQLGFGKTPLLLLYCIDRDSKASPRSVRREDLATAVDILAFAVIVPGDKRASSTSAVWIELGPKGGDEA